MSKTIALLARLRCGRLEESGRLSDHDFQVLLVSPAVVVGLDVGLGSAEVERFLGLSEGHGDEQGGEEQV